MKKINFLMMSFKKSFFLTIVLFSLILIFPLVACAQDQFIIEASETKSDTQFISASNVFIEGKVLGDVFTVSSELTITGEIDGNLFFLGSRLNIAKSAKISGSVFALASKISLAGKLEGNVYLAGSEIYTTRDLVAQNEANFASSKADLEGTFEKTVRGSAPEINLSNSNFKKSLILETKYLSYTPKTTVKDRLAYRSPYKALLAEENLGGAPNIGEERWIKVKLPTYWDKFGNRLIKSLISFGYLLIFGFLWIWLWQEKYKTVVLSLREHLWPALGWGVVLVLVFPSLFIFLLISILGIPIALLLLGLLIFWGYMATVVVGGFIGAYIMQLFGKDSEKRPYLALFLGVLFMFILYSLPGIGWVFKMFAILLALGVLITSRKTILGVNF